MHKVETSPDAYIASLPDDARGDMARLDEEISRVMAGLTRVLWEGTFWGGSEQHIIGYGDTSYVRPGNKRVDWFIIGLARQKNYISVYVNAVEDKQYLTERYASDLGAAKIGKSSISFKRLDDIHLDKLLELITRARELMA